MHGLIKSFGYAFHGIFVCIRQERNMRIHLCFTAYLFGFLTAFDWFTVSRSQYALLFIVCALVIGGELINTAVENTVDLACKEKNTFAQTAKDCAAGAVLVNAIFAVCTGIAVLWQPRAFQKMFGYYGAHPGMLGLLLASIAAALCFVFLPCRGKKAEKAITVNTAKKPFE